MKLITKPSVLIIDDDSIYTAILRNRLSAKTSVINIADTAERGSHFLTKNQPDLVFLDNKLPKLNGIEVLKLYKEIAPKSKIILISSKYEIEDIAIGIQNGADFVSNKNELTNKKIDEIIEQITESEEVVSFKEGVKRFFTKKEVDNVKNTNDIAIIEDDELFSLHLKTELSKICPEANISSYSNCVDFYDGILESKSRPYLILLDYNIPYFNGEYILKNIKENLDKTKVVVFSAQSDPDVAIRLKELGAENYIIKNEDWKMTLGKVMEGIHLT